MALRVATCVPWWSEQPFAPFHGRENKDARWTSHLRPRISSPTMEKLNSYRTFMNQLTQDIPARRFSPQFDCAPPEAVLAELRLGSAPSPTEKPRPGPIAPRARATPSADPRWKERLS
jgi:hypothetical protein